MVDFEPLEACHRTLGRIWNLGAKDAKYISQENLLEARGHVVQVCQNGSLVGRVDRIGSISGTSTCECMMEFCGDLSTSRDWDDSFR